MVKEKIIQTKKIVLEFQVQSNLKQNKANQDHWEKNEYLSKV